mmetsp:Transcript_2464/g.6139  ORF Transcript_2464/g.6139 Transcript_2464/m.6139 type:complete len:265 (-) Transcript_2464:605-1399(-)
MGFLAALRLVLLVPLSAGAVWQGLGSMGAASTSLLLAASLRLKLSLPSVAFVALAAAFCALKASRRDATEPSSNLKLVSGTASMLSSSTCPSTDSNQSEPNSAPSSSSSLSLPVCRGRREASLRLCMAASHAALKLLPSSNFSGSRTASSLMANLLCFVLEACSSFRTPKAYKQCAAEAMKFVRGFGGGLSASPSLSSLDASFSRTACILAISALILCTRSVIIWPDSWKLVSKSEMSDTMSEVCELREHKSFVHFSADAKTFA